MVPAGASSKLHALTVLRWSAKNASGTMTTIPAALVTPAARASIAAIHQRSCRAMYTDHTVSASSNDSRYAGTRAGRSGSTDPARGNGDFDLVEQAFRSARWTESDAS